MSMSTASGTALNRRPKAKRRKRLGNAPFKYTPAGQERKPQIMTKMVPYKPVTRAASLKR